MEKDELKEKLDAGKEKAKAGAGKVNEKIKGLAFRGMLEKRVSPETRTKFPILHKLIPISNYIACGVAVVVVVIVVAALLRGGGSDSRDRGMQTASQDSLDRGMQTASQEGSEPGFALDLRISQQQEEEFDDFEQNLMGWGAFEIEGQERQAPVRGDTGDEGTLAWMLREGPKRLDAMERAVTNRVSEDEWEVIEELAYDIVYAKRIMDEAPNPQWTPEQQQLLYQLDDRYMSYIRRRNSRQ